MESRSLGWRDEQWEAGGLWEEREMGWRWLDGKDGTFGWRFFRAFPFLGKLCVLFHPSMPCQSSPQALHQAAFPNPTSSWEFSPMPMDRHLPSWSQHLLAAPDHPGGEIPEPVLNQFFLEITSHFLTQIISFCLRGSSLEFLNATTRIDEVTGKCMAVDSCFPGDFSSPSNQGRQCLSP